MAVEIPGLSIQMWLRGDSYGWVMIKYLRLSVKGTTEHVTGTIGMR